jgi:phosphoribosylglycinamide formyltransferase-1
LKKIIIITGNELRHDFFKKYIAASKEIQVLKTYCEVPETSLLQHIQTEDNNNSRSRHLQMREQAEQDFFGLFCARVPDDSNSVFIAKGTINSKAAVNEISNLNPDIIIAYGCSIIKSPLLDAFSGRFVNIHLGLSPYYRGSATNFFPFINNEVSCVGVTFMHIDEGIDTGKIIHQMRPTIVFGDTIHQIGNRLIKEMAEVCEKIIIHFDNLEEQKPLHFDQTKEKVYRNKDFTEETVAIMYQKFADGIIENYLNNKTDLDALYPLFHNPILD